MLDGEFVGRFVLCVVWCVVVCCCLIWCGGVVCFVVWCGVVFWFVVVLGGVFFRAVEGIGDAWELGGFGEV